MRSLPGYSAVETTSRPSTPIPPNPGTSAAQNVRSTPTFSTVPRARSQVTLTPSGSFEVCAQLLFAGIVMVTIFGLLLIDPLVDLRVKV